MGLALWSHALNKEPCKAISCGGLCLVITPTICNKNHRENPSFSKSTFTALLGGFQHCLEGQGEIYLKSTGGRGRHTEAWLCPVIWDKCQQLHATWVRYFCPNSYIREKRVFSSRMVYTRYRKIKSLATIAIKKINTSAARQSTTALSYCSYPTDKSTSICWC